jgi:hypothetical protein
MAMNGAVVVRWGANVAGREAKGLEVFGNAVAHFEGLLKAGRIHSHKEFFAVTGGDGGFMIAEGELSELLAITAEEDTLRMNAQAAAIVQDFEVQVYGGGTDQAIQGLVGLYANGMQEIGYL